MSAVKCSSAHVDGERHAPRRAARDPREAARRRARSMSVDRVAVRAQRARCSGRARGRGRPPARRTRARRASSRSSFTHVGGARARSRRRSARRRGRRSTGCRRTLVTDVPAAVPVARHARVDVEAKVADLDGSWDCGHASRACRRGARVAAGRSRRARFLSFRASRCSRADDRRCPPSTRCTSPSSSQRWGVDAGRAPRGARARRGGARRTRRARCRSPIVRAARRARARAHRRAGARRLISGCRCASRRTATSGFAAMTASTAARGARARRRASRRRAPPRSRSALARRAGATRVARHRGAAPTSARRATRSFSR